MIISGKNSASCTKLQIMFSGVGLKVDATGPSLCSSEWEHNVSSDFEGLADCAGIVSDQDEDVSSRGSLSSICGSLIDSSGVVLSASEIICMYDPFQFTAEKFLPEVRSSSAESSTPLIPDSLKND